MVKGKEIAYFEMHVYYRWGNEVYTTTNIGEGWSGFKDNKICPSGVYIVKLDYSFNPTPVIIQTRIERVNLIR